MRFFLATYVMLLTLVGVAVAPLSHAADHGSKQRPNIVLVMVDDMGFSDLGCYGGEIDTPTLDKLAYSGVRFTQFYNGAKCETTRRMLLTGLYHPEVNLSQNHNVTLAEVLGGAGYTTLMSGKWHIKSTPPERGFQRYWGHLSGSTPFFLGNDSFRLDSKKYEIPEDGFYTTYAMTDYALKFLDWSQQGDRKDKPFFLYIAYNAPHYPLQAPKDQVQKYIGKYMDGWDALRKARFERQKKLGLFQSPVKFTPAHFEAKQWDKLTEEQKKREDLQMATYAAMIDIVDQGLAKVVDRIKGMGDGEWENTLFLFLSDNGACPFDRTKKGHLDPWHPESYWCYHQAWANACNTPLRWFKQNQHEGGINTPLIAHWPKGITKPGRITAQSGHLVDIMATLADVGRAKYPSQHKGTKVKPLRGKSLNPIFQGKQRPGHDAMWFQFSNNRALRAGDMKLVSARGKPWELYNIAKDRSEMNNLAESKPDVVKAMSAKWDALAKDMGMKYANKKRGGKKKPK